MDSDSRTCNGNCWVSKSGFQSFCFRIVQGPRTVHFCTKPVRIGLEIKCHSRALQCHPSFGYHDSVKVHNNNIAYSHGSEKACVRPIAILEQSWANRLKTTISNDKNHTKKAFGVRIPKREVSRSILVSKIDCFWLKLMLDRWKYAKTLSRMTHWHSKAFFVWILGVSTWDFQRFGNGSVKLQIDVTQDA